jgi:hypothetical protein
MDTGRFGNIKSVEDWRYKELKSLGITFSSNTKIPNSTVNDAVFYNGLFLTGKNSKSQTILNYIQYLDAETIVLIDDREEHLEDLRKFCENKSIQFIGILFSGLENFKDRPNDNVVQFQKQHLIKNAQWLEDAEAERMMAEFPAAARS